MDIFSKNKFLAWVIIILIVMNVVTLGALWLQRDRVHDYPGRFHHLNNGMNNGDDDRRRPRTGDFLEQELNFTEEQSKQFEELRDGHRQTADRLLGEMKDAREQLFDLIKSDSPDMSKATELENLIGQKTTELEEATFEHFSQVRAICNDEQKKKFDEIIGDMMKMMGPGRGPGGPPGDHRNGPPGMGPRGNRPPR